MAGKHSSQLEWYLFTYGRSAVIMIRLNSPSMRLSVNVKLHC